MRLLYHWMALLLLAVCSVKCHWRRQAPSKSPADVKFVERSRESSPKSTSLNARSCPPSNICISTISCPDVLHLLEKAVKEPSLREQTIALVRKMFHKCPPPYSQISGETKGVWKEVREEGLLPSHSYWAFPQQSSTHGRLK